MSSDFLGQHYSWGHQHLSSPFSVKKMQTQRRQLSGIPLLKACDLLLYLLYYTLPFQVRGKKPSTATSKKTASSLQTAPFYIICKFCKFQRNIYSHLMLFIVSQKLFAISYNNGGLVKLFLWRLVFFLVVIHSKMQKNIFLVVPRAPRNQKSTGGGG